MNLRRALLFVCVFITYGVAFAEGVSSNEWTQTERQWVDQARKLYKDQGIEFGDSQAEEAIFKMRSKAMAGVPPSEWTPMEQKMIVDLRALYQKRNMQLSEEQERIQVQSMREKIAQMKKSFGVIQGLSDGTIKQIPTPVAITVPAATEIATVSKGMTEADMAVRIDNYPKIAENIDIHGRRDGFDVNGRTVLDSEGRIVAYAFDVLNGDVTYLLSSGNSYAIKFMRASTVAEPIQIANASKNRNGEWEVATATGKKITGLSLTMAPSGFLVGRESSAFRYEPGKGVRNVAIPDGFLLAAVQHGNVGATGYVLLEKDQTDSSADGAKSMLNTFKSLGSTLGLNKKEDYALMSMESGKLYPLNMDSDGKQVMKMSNCRKKNMLINECSSATSFESIYTPDGNPNMGHYYWRTNWFNTPSGPIAVAMENGLKDIYVIDLTTGKKVTGFSRLLGIQSFNTKQFSDGHVSLSANWAFTTHEIPDLEAHLKTSENIPNQTVETKTQ